ncbi:hypothetical protein [Arthrobacter sp. N199823]|uniref:hypothetical protein n=1 Tax=Arthrobacter sp. N199823 TaxID=2058895 RepID=UPI0015E463A9|nr:hypothetical protein [Arthrobacter sp. N199823]
MSDSLLMALVIGAFVLIVVVLVVLLIVGRFRAAKPGALPPEHVPYPGGQAIPPTGSR